MRPEEVSAVGELAGDAVAGLTSHIRDMHSGIAERVFSAVGAAAEPVRVAHDGIAGGVYEGARLLTGGLIRAAGRAISVTRPDDAPSIERSARGRIALGALNRAFGDGLHARGNELALRMTLRRDGRDLVITHEGLADVFPGATPRLAVFVHGLCETDDAWRLGADRHVPYGPRLHAELGYSPLYLRYNTGRHVSENGRQLGRCSSR